MENRIEVQSGVNFGNSKAKRENIIDDFGSGMKHIYQCWQSADNNKGCRPLRSRKSAIKNFHFTTSNRQN